MSVTQASANARAASELLHALARLGLRRVVLCPGSRNTPLVLAADANAALEVELLHDERVAAFYALGLSRGDGHATALITTSGSAIAHALPAVIEAHSSDVPLLLLSADRPPELHDCAAPQTTRQGQLLASHTRHSMELGAPAPGEEIDSLATAAARAWSAAHGLPPGPVHLNLPFREPLWEPDIVYPRGTRAPRMLAGRVELSSGQLDALASELDQRRTLVVCGPLTGADRPQELRAALTSLASRQGWPIIADLSTGLRHQEQSAPVVAAADSIARCDDASLLEALMPTQVLSFGLPPTSQALGRLLTRWETRVISFDAAGRTRDPRHKASLFVSADPCAVVEGLIQRLHEAAPAQFTRSWLQADELATYALEEETAKGLWSGAVTHALMEALPAGSLLHLASSMPIRDADAFAAKSSKRLYFAASRGINGIDGTLATFGGEAHSHDGAAALLMGDTALVHDVGGLLALAKQARPLTIVVINNGGAGIFSHLPIAAHGAAFERYFRAPHGADIEALCRGVDIQYQAVRGRDALFPALERALRQKTTSLVEIALDHDDDLNRHRRAWAQAAAALRQRTIGANA